MMPKDWDQLKRPLRFQSALVIAYWRAEVALNCAASLRRLRRICKERGADYGKTLQTLEATSHEQN